MIQLYQEKKKHNSSTLKFRKKTKKAVINHSATLLLSNRAFLKYAKPHAVPQSI